jgi:hypothetical protein
VVGGGLVGIFLLGVAAVLWLSADLRDEWRKLADLDESLGRLEGRPAAMATPAQPVAAPANGVVLRGEIPRAVGSAG